jgi:hypothetical protein
MDEVDKAFLKMVVKLISALLSIIITIGLTLNYFSCSNRWSDSGIEYQFGIMSGCRLKVDGQWTPESNYRKF